jgi:ATP-dependent protease ClpP protease subunit
MATRLVIASVFAVLCSSAAAQNTMSLDEMVRLGYTTRPESFCDKNICNIYLSGQITSELYTKIKTIIARRDPKKTVEVYVDSPGGDLEAAIQLGRLFRDSAPVTAVVAPASICASACVMSLVGATNRVIGGKVAIHRPYTVDAANRSYADLQSQFSSVDASARKYLADMNIASTFYDEMLRHPPESVRILGAAELKAYRISGWDYVYEESMQRRHAKHLGISRQTYLERLSLADKICSTPASRNSTEGADGLAKRYDCQSRVLSTGRP